ncbi:GAF domain-containing protein [Leuconostoc citreum]|uniref:GAF domain-containing protein n=1 Tax=Leuconostoc citreum TaxID=33964 RepID=UPI002072D50E|nr:GAF domain-containing protein [Leuconostoc citreum]MCT3059184.1 GAF domain-containing protein [Leuconostoc citreum]MCT3070550.1 GAF domain-containing protein [Leuconostoc citreum]MDM7640808.1 GAF domain-containing protein [Leuconostoc citreum]
MLEEQNRVPLISQLLETWIQGEVSQNYQLANYSNAAAILFQKMKQLNWVGFYLYDEESDKLVVGPFLGKPAVALISPESGVVGKAFSAQKTIIVSDVHSFSGHIVCDPESKSEIVVPIITRDGKRLGVLDIDSPELNRFTLEDQVSLEHFVQTLLEYVYK